MEDTTAEEAAPTPENTRLLKYQELVEVLNSENVETLYRGLSAFNRTLSKLVREEVDAEVSGEGDLVRAYFKGSPECAELFRIWDFQQTNKVDRLEVIILEVLSRVIPVAKMVGSRSIGTGMVRNVIRNHMKILYRNLSSGKHVVIQSTLRLLVAVTGYGQGTTRELQETFNFTMKALHKLLTIRKKSAAGQEGTKPRKAEDVRTLYIRFILAFLVRGDVGVKKAVLETKDFVSGIFKGMAEDTYETVEFVLSTLRRAVIDDVHLGRSVKVAFFNNYVLEQLARLYFRNDVSSDGGDVSISDLAHEFMLHLCTNPGVGVCFQDAGWYPAQSSGGKKHIKVYNAVLLRFLGVLHPTENLNQEKLVLAILKSCPELVQPYWNSLTALSFDPRLSSRWLANMALVAKVIQLPVPSHFGAPSPSLSPPPVGTVADNVLPCVLSRAILGRALLHSSRLVKYTAAGVLALAFGKLAEVRRAVNLAMTESTESAPQWRKASTQLLEEIRRRVPELQIVLALQNTKALGDVDTEMVDALLEEVDKQAVETEKEVSAELLQSAALRLLRHYQRYFPETVLESRFDYGKLLPADLMSLPTELQWHLLQLVGEVHEFKWWNRAPNAQHSHLSSLLRFHLSAPDTQLSTLSLRVLTRLLTDSFLFSGRADEIQIWISSLRYLTPPERVAAITWLDEAFCAGVRNPYRVVDRLTEIVNTGREGLGEMEKRVLEHYVACRRKSEVEEDEGEDAQFPVGPAVVCAAEGLHVMIRRVAERKAGTDKVSLAAAAKCFLGAIVGLMNTTQAAGVYLSEVVRKAREGFNGENKNTAQPPDLHELGVETYLAAAEIYTKRYAESGEAMEIDGEETASGADVQKRWKKVNKNLKSETPDTDIFQSFLSSTSPKSLNAVLPAVLERAQGNAALTSMLVSFLMHHHPLRQSIFSTYSAFGELGAADTTGEDDAALAFLRHLPFTGILSNLFSYAAETGHALFPVLRQVVHNSFSGTTAVEWVGFARQCLLELTRLTRHENGRAVVEVGMEMLRMILEKAWSEKVGGTEPVDDEEEMVVAERKRAYEGVRDVVFRHPLVLDAFLSVSSRDADGLFSSEVLALVKDCMGLEKPQTPSSRSSASVPLPTVWRLYTTRVQDRVFSELAADTATPSSDTVSAFSAFRSFLDAEDIDKLLARLFQISATSTQHDQMLFLALTAVGGREGRTIRAEDFGKLLELMRTRPSVEVDRIVLGALLGATVPEALRDSSEIGAGFIRVVVTGSGDSSSDGVLFADVPQMFDEASLRFLVKDANGIKLEILRALIEASPVHRSWAINYVRKSARKLGDEAAVVFLESLVTSLSVMQSAGGGRKKVTWAASATSKDREAIASLHSRVSGMLAEKMRQRVSGHAETGPSLGAREGEKMFRLVQLFPGDYIGAFDTVVSQPKPTDAVIACAWAGEYFESILSSSENEADQAAGTIRTLKISLWALRSFFAERKKSIVHDDGEKAVGRLLGLLKNLIKGSLGGGAGIKVVESLLVTEELREIVKGFMLTSLKYRLADENVLQVLDALVQALYSKKGSLSKSARKALPFEVSALADMVTSHSQFEVITRPLEDTTSTPASKTTIAPSHPAKLSLLRLLRTILALEPIHCCRTSYLPLLASAYQGTMSDADRTILEIWRLYECEAGISVASSAATWGNTGSGADRTLGLSPASAAESIGAIDPIWMAHTIQWFLVDDALESSTRPDPSSTAKSSKLASLYDPKFFLPLLATALIHGDARLDIRRAIETNAIGLAVMSLSSQDPHMRNAGYFILDRATAMIAASDIKEHYQIMLLLDGLRNAVTERNHKGVSQRIPSVIALFAAQGLMVLLKPESDMYPLINRFLLQRPIIDLEDVPMFYGLFYSPSQECRRERVWMLRLLSCGLKTPADYRLYKRRHVFDILIGFFQSPLADALSRKLVIELIFKATFIPSILADMITRSGLLTFLHTCITTLEMTPSNDFALALPRLCTRVLKGWMRADPAWFGRTGRGVWMDTFTTLAVAWVQRVAIATRGGVAGKVEWWSNVVVDTVEFVSTVVECADKEVDGEGGKVPVAIGLGHVAALLKLLDECVAGTKGGGGGVAVRDATDLDALYSLQTDTAHLLTVGRTALFGATTRLGVNLPSAHTLGSSDGLEVRNTLTLVTSWLLDRVETDAGVWRDDGMMVERFLEWVLKIQEAYPWGFGVGVKPDLVARMVRVLAMVGRVGNARVAAGLANANLAVLGKDRGRNDARFDPPTDPPATPLSLLPIILPSVSSTGSREDEKTIASELAGAVLQFAWGFEWEAKDDGLWRLYLAGIVDEMEKGPVRKAVKRLLK
ncbi:hypothetical protein HK104_003568 [Borealophlyctis nickersoniae]|nr:hypothetical protein HK104_003568 [Borealophlyctis nickersoniae]